MAGRSEDIVSYVAGWSEDIVSYVAGWSEDIRHVGAENSMSGSFSNQTSR